MPDPAWRLPDGPVPLDAMRIMAIVNATPDSFVAASRLGDPEAAAGFALDAVDDGAELLDVGGESTRPGAQRVSIDDQVARVVPVIRAIREAGVEAPISIDTTRAAVAEAALGVGASIINDVSAGGEDPSMLPLAADRGAGLILMHRLRPPDADTFSHRYAKPPVYEPDVVTAVHDALARARDRAIGAGVAAEAIVVDPGLGFGNNFALIRASGELQRRLGCPLLSAASRKSFLGAASGLDDPGDRLAPSVAVTVAHALLGLRLFRVHDPAPHAAALAVAGRL